MPILYVLYTCMYYVYYMYILHTHTYTHTHRKDRLWIAMEFCGGGSLQDIYHGIM